MNRTRRAVKRTPIVEASSDSEDDIPLKKANKIPIDNRSTPEKKANNNESSSSESDIENYLQPIDKIDLNSSFFSIQKKHEEEFNKIEKDIFAGVTRLSDSDSDEEMSYIDAAPQDSKQEQRQSDLNKPSSSSTNVNLNFQQLEEYTRKIEEAKKHVEQYNAKKKAEENNMDITNLLAAGELKQLTLDNIKPEDLHSSDFESCDSEQEDWEEVKVKESQEIKEKSLVPKDGLQITVDMPETCRKKKGVDLLAAMKRRLNRIRKENQVFVHKVHLLCWIAHGNYVNEIINNTQILGLALSLLPSDKCYPSDRTDLSYLEQIVQWYKKTIKLIDKPVPKDLQLENAIQLQINRKEAFNKKMLVYIFVSILRALGIQCRLVLSFQVEPLRPPAGELHSLAKENTKKDSKTTDKNKKTTSRVKEKTSVITEKDTGVKNSQKKGGTEHVVKKDTVTKKEIKEMGKKESRSNITNKKPQNNDKKEVSKKTASKKESTELTKKEDSKSALKKKNVETSKKEKDSTLNKKGKEAESSSKVDEKTHELMEDTETGKRKLPKRNVKISQEKTGEIGVGSRTLKVEEKNVRSKSADTKTKPENSQRKSNRLTVRDTQNKRSKSEEIGEARDSRSKIALKKGVIKVELPKKEKPNKISQLDGTNNSSDEDTGFDIIYPCGIPQLDGADDSNIKKTSAKTKKPNLKKLNNLAENSCERKKHPSRLKAAAEDSNSENEFRPESSPTKKTIQSPKVEHHRKVNLQKLKSPIGQNVHPLNSSPKKQLNVKNDIINLIKGRIAEQKHIDRRRMVKKRKPVSDDSDSDYMPEPIKKKYHSSDSDVEYFVPKPKVKQRVSFRKVKVDQKIVSSDSDVDKAGKKKKKGINVWVEVFLENEEKWISVDVTHGQVHCVNELHTRATHPVCYVVAWNNNNSIKDVTMRYCKNFNTITRKLRVDAKWWEETLKPFRGTYTAKDKEEDDDLNRQQLDQPLPKSISEYKNHPLYALRRHLLKFEEIYPPDIQPLGYVRGEPVYPRNCVYTCRSRDIWLKEARVVKPGEKPYKIVKARPKYDKLSNQMITDQMLEIFGVWQTTEYEPPTAENGVVPRNAFGNVELFKPCMLPKGTVHLKLPGLNKICKRMDIDCASAIVGFDFHGGWSHPTYDGFVVCEEYADTLVAAWELEQDEMEKKENEKIEKRVYGNWKKLIRGLLIRERLKAKYDFGSTSGEGVKEKKKAKGPRFCTKKRRVYSDSESESDNT